MSTTDDISARVESGDIVPCRPPLRGREQPCRLLYFVRSADNRAISLLKSAVADGFVDGALPPRDQFMVLIRRFVSGDPFDDPQPHPMRPEDEGIWRIRTHDLRVVGWFPARGIFIITEVELKQNCTAERDEQLLQEARKAREDLSIGGGTFLTGGLHDCI